MIRLDRKLGFIIDGLMGGAGIAGLVDYTVMEAFRITDEEYDYLCENMSDSEMDLFIRAGNLSFSDKRILITMLDRYIKKFNDIK
jgi:hypothetical protein